MGDVGLNRGAKRGHVVEQPPSQCQTGGDHELGEKTHGGELVRPGPADATEFSAGVSPGRGMWQGAAGVVGGRYGPDSGSLSVLVVVRPWVDNSRTATLEAVSV